MMYDVIVVGAGPAGSVAAKKCAERGLQTLLLERWKLPRDKVCSGVVMGPWAQDATREEFGEIPREVLSAPYHMLGVSLYVPGVEPQTIEMDMFITWRKDLDYWMTQKAKDKGAEVWDETKVLSVAQQDVPTMSGSVEVVRNHEKQVLRSRFVVGADGSNSAVRKSLFPGLKVRYTPAYRECYQGKLELDEKYWHWFTPVSLRPRIAVMYKGENLLVEGGVKQLKDDVRRILGEYGFDPNWQPIWKDGCVTAWLYDELFSGSFQPAQGNILLTGDAAGLQIPVTREGIGSALKSGVLAASAIAKAIDHGEEAQKVYLQGLQGMISTLKKLHPLSKRVQEQAAKGPQALSDTLTDAWRQALNAT